MQLEPIPSCHQRVSDLHLIGALNNKHDIKYKSIITKYDHCVLGNRLYSMVQDIINYKAMVILNINHHFAHL